MKKQKFFDITPQPPKIILVGLTHLGQKKGETEEHLRELALLADTGGMQIVKQFIQKLDHPSTSTMIRIGKMEEIKTFIGEHKVERIIFDDELTPLQTKNLEEAWRCEVWDRSHLILHIFAMHARTLQSKTQVELAYYQYLLPRLIGMWSHLSRQKGGSASMRGPGEKELETDRRIAQERIRVLKQKLVKIEQVSKTQRKERREKTNITLVGYTNAGKSSLMRVLSKEDVLVADQLFATLSPTVRKIRIKNQSFLLADTVGFIHKLPHSLIECFKSTLAEVREADFLLHVVDFSHPNYVHHIQVVQEVLHEIGADKVPSMLVLNKKDLAMTQYVQNMTSLEAQDPHVFCMAEKERLAQHYALPVVCCSAVEGEGIEELKNTVYRLLAQSKGKASYMAP